MSPDDSQPSDHEPTDDHSRLDLSIHRQAVFGTEGLGVETGAVETTLTDHGIEVGHQRSTRLDVPTSENFVDDRSQTSAGNVDAGKQESLFASSSPGQRTLDDRDASMVPLFGDRSDSRPSDTAEE
ncbi:hypothetical protein DU500_17375 (plasmid) [Haloplanus rubicundus]|uniref:Uncharacterized protein n=1 Tax=Haloplanus rubicundus TaxID=1547898 RepID=A0A345E7U0_9EURY|nr:hypothetical protein [Haloplanus rubicundus]AXG08262.1 hypothetical protein DU500_17375 [Haloplanus rubicundus]